MTAMALFSFFFGALVLACVACAAALLRRWHRRNGGRDEQWSSVRKITARRDG